MTRAGPEPGPVACDTVRDLAAGYVLGALEPEEMAAVRAHLAGCAAPHPELAELGGAVAALALSVEPIEPADAVRRRILHAVAAEATPAPAGTPLARPTMRGPATGDVSSVAAGRRGWSWGGAWVRAAMVGLSLVIVVLATSTAWLAGRLAESQGYAQQLARATELAAIPGSRTVALVPTADGLASTNGFAVFTSDGRGMVVLDGLAPVAGSEVYELWVIQENGAPTAAGSFRVSASGQGWLTQVAAPAGQVTVAITREPAPGAITPTLPVLAAGVAAPG